MRIDFFTASNMTEFWGYCKMLLETVQPGVMLVTAAAGVGLLIGILVKTFRKAEKAQDDDDEIEIRRY